MKRTVLEMRNVQAEDERHGRAMDITFSLYAGQVLIMTGLTVSGIHAVTKLLTGQIQNYQGDIYIRGRELRTCPARGSVQSGIVVFGMGRLSFDHFTLEENLTLFQGQERMLRRVQTIRYNAEETELLELLRLPKHGTAMTAFQQLKREVFLAYASGVKAMVFSDLSACCTESASVEFNRILAFLKAHGIAVLLTVFNDQLENFEALADACIVVRNGMTANCLYKEGRRGFDADVVHHITVGREFVRRSPAARTEAQRLEEPVLRLTSKRSGGVLPVYPGQLVGIYDEQAEIPALISDLPAYIGEHYLVEKDGKALSISEPGDLVKNRIAVLHHRDVENMLFPNLTPEENVAFFAQNYFDRQGVFRYRMSQYLFRQVTEKFSIKRVASLEGRRDCECLSALDALSLVTAKWLAINPDVTIMFAPSINDDIKRVEWLREIRQRLIAKGKAIVLIMSHYHAYDEDSMQMVKLE